MNIKVGFEEKYISLYHRGMKLIEINRVMIIIKIVKF